MELYGYAGKILYVNLTNSEIWETPLDPELAVRFIGGWGINHKLYYDLVPSRVEPLAPENALIVGTGILNGTMVPGASRTYIAYKHPLSGTVGSAPGTGIFSNMLKSAGYDHVVITGKAMEPVYLVISQGSVELCDARGLWGIKDTFDTVYALRSAYEPCSIIAIGPAGEHLVNISVTNIDSGQGGIGEGGMCAVMGSKNLKAIVAVQGATPVRVAHPRRLQKAVDEVLERIRTYPRLNGLRDGGGWYMMRGGAFGSEIIPQNQDEIKAEAEAFEAHKRSRSIIACACCPVAGRERIYLAEGKYAGMLSYSSLMTYGLTPNMIMTDTEELVPNMLKTFLNYDQLVKYEDVLNRYGVDMFLFGGIIQLLLARYEDGTITRQDIDGFELERHFDTLMELARMAAYREGLGDIIADGIVSVCNRIGLDPEKDAIHIKGWNRANDPRISGLDTNIISELTRPRGGISCAGGTHPASYLTGQPVDRWLRYAREQGLTKEAEERIFTATSFNPARLVKWMHSYFSVLQSLGFCGRLYIERFHDLGIMAEYYSAITGTEISPVELLNIGERNWNLNKLLNIREGFNRNDDRPPEAWFKPLKIKGTKTELFLMDYYRTVQLNRQDVEKLLDDYYDECGWDKGTSAPTSKKLKKLGLEDITF
jgi:aldehyde:ferredoxin oxidoreductase